MCRDANDGSYDRVRLVETTGVRVRRSVRTTLVACATICGSISQATSIPIGRAVVDLDVRRTRVTFTLAGSLHRTEGVVPLTEGRLEIEPHAGAAGGLVVADARATTTGNGLRDATMHGDVLETDRFPDIRFRPTGVDGASLGDDGEFTGTLRGTLTLHGSTHELDLPVHGRLVGDDVTASCRFTIPYVAWGLRDPSVLFLTVAKTVAVEVRAVGRMSRPAPVR